MACAARAQSPPASAPAPSVTNFLHTEPGSLSIAGVTFYGIIDINAVYQDHGAPRSSYASTALSYPVAANAERSRFQYAANGLSQSFIGLKGDTPLTALTGHDALSGWALTFDFQSGFDPVTGQIANGIRSVSAANGVPLRRQDVVSDSSRAGQIFNGDAWGGIKHPVLGELRYGRQTTVAGDAIGPYDPQRGSYAFSPLGFFGAFAGGLGATELLRWNDSLKYKNTFGPLRASAQYRFEGSGQGGEDYAFGLGFDFPGVAKGLHVDGFWGHMTSAIVSAPLNTPQCAALAPQGACDSLNIVNATVSKNDAFGVMVRYDVDKLSLYGGWQQITFSNGADPVGTRIQGGFLLNPLTGGSNNNFFRYLTDRVQNVTWLGFRYALTPQLSAAVGYYHIEQNGWLAGTTSPTGTLAAGSATNCQQATNTNITVNSVRPITDTRSTAGLVQTGSNCAGREDLASLSLVYQATKRLDVYTGIMWSGVSGGLASGFLHRTSVDPQVGVRFKL